MGGEARRESRNRDARLVPELKLVSSPTATREKETALGEAARDKTWGQFRTTDRPTRNQTHSSPIPASASVDGSGVCVVVTPN